MPTNRPVLGAGGGSRVGVAPIRAPGPICLGLHPRLAVLISPVSHFAGWMGPPSCLKFRVSLPGDSLCARQGPPTLCAHCGHQWRGRTKSILGREKSLCPRGNVLYTLVTGLS